MRRPSSIPTTVALAALLLPLSCTTQTAGLTWAGLRVPGLSDAPTGQHRPGAIVWYDLLSEDVPAARRFYGSLFGWTFETVGLNLGLARTDGYTIVRHHGRPIGGIVDATLLPVTQNVSQWVPSLSVQDVDGAVRALQAGGGRVLVPAQVLKGRGRLAVVADPEGAVLTLIHASDGDPIATDASDGDFLWTELWSDDVEAAAGFYHDVASWVAEEFLLPSGIYRHFDTDGEPVAGLLPKPVAELPPTWVTYVRVDDTVAIANRVRGLGGKVVGAPRQNPAGGEVAVIVDPTGAGFLVQRVAPDPAGFL
jgi:predicted enzyme related to lactoylglutathione lyase